MFAHQALFGARSHCLSCPHNAVELVTKMSWKRKRASCLEIELLAMNLTCLGCCLATCLLHDLSKKEMIIRPICKHTLKYFEHIAHLIYLSTCSVYTRINSHLQKEVYKKSLDSDYILRAYGLWAPKGDLHSVACIAVAWCGKAWCDKT